jgi:two-component system chemotaxis response regulator CheY
MKVLVVDDSAVMRKVLMDALMKTGIQNVGQASNGVAAVAAVMDGNFDLVLMDWNMPKMDGLEAVKEIRAKGINIPIIMVTTESEKNRVLEALKSGANNYIVKPFTPELVASKIKETMSR